MPFEHEPTARPNAAWTPVCWERDAHTPYNASGFGQAVGLVEDPQRVDVALGQP